MEEAAVQTPYPGLRPFREEEACYFFGQDTPLADLRERLYKDQFVAILGLSGCGKSSLLKAGLLADFRSKRIRGPRPRWLIGYMKPGGDPLQRLVEAVADIQSQLNTQRARFGEEPAPISGKFANALEADGYGLARFGHQAELWEGQDILIVVDQFEELFRYQRECATHKQKDRAALFVQLLIEAARDKDCHVSVVITMRSEFLGDCSLFFGLAEQVNDGTFLLPKMTRDQIEEVIVGPAEEAGFQIEPGVVQEFLNETDKQDDGLPLLQHALRRVYQHWLERGATGAISAKDLCSFQTRPPEGTLLIKHHLDDHLNSIYSALSVAEKRAAKALFRLLSERDARGRVTRRPLAFPEIVKYTGKNSEAQLKAAIEAFRDEKRGRTFLTPGWPDPLEKEVIDISHECLLRRWERLQQWILFEQQDAEQFRRLAGDADDAECQARRTGQPRKPLEGATLENFVRWRGEAEVVTGNWARRYEGEFSDELGRNRYSFSAAEEYLEWSAQQAKERAARAKADEEARIRSEEKARQAIIESELATEQAGRMEVQASLAREREHRRRNMWILSFILLGILAVGAVTASQLRARALQAEQSVLQEQRQAAQDRQRIAEKNEKQQAANASKQEQLSNQLKKSVKSLAEARDQLTQKTIDLQEVIKKLDQASADLKRANSELQDNNQALTKEKNTAESLRGNAEAETARANEALENAKRLGQQLEKEEKWLAAVVVASEMFAESHGGGSSRRNAVLRALEGVEQATDDLGLKRGIPELFGVRKAGLNALGEAIVPELIASSLQTGPGIAACYSEKSGTIFSLLGSEGLKDNQSVTDSGPSGRIAPNSASKGFALFYGNRRAGNAFLDPILGNVMRIYRGRFFVRRDDLPNARDLSDNCETAAIGSRNGVIDRYDIVSGRLNEAVRRLLGDYIVPGHAPLHHRGSIEMVRVSPDGQRAVTAFAGGGWSLWQTESGRMTAGEEKSTVDSGTFSPNGRWLLLAESNGRTSRFDLNISPPTATKITTGCCNTSVNVRQQSDVSDDGSVAWFEGGSSVLQYRPAGAAAPQSFAQAGRATLKSVRLDPEGKWIAAGRDDGTVEVWPVDRPTERPIRLPDQTIPSSPVAALSWTRSGRFLTVLHGSGTVHVWRVQEDVSSGRVEQIRRVLRLVDEEAQKAEPGDTRMLVRLVRELPSDGGQVRTSAGLR